MSELKIEDVKSVVDQGLGSKANTADLETAQATIAAQAESLKSLEGQVEEMKNLQADLEQKQAESVKAVAAQPAAFDVKAANQALKAAFATKQAFNFADLEMKTVNTGEDGIEYAIDDELGRTIIERARENVAILGLIGMKTVSSTSYREMVLKTYPTTAVGSEQTGSTAPGDVWALTSGAEYTEVTMNVGKQYAKPQISDEVIADPAINVYAHLQSLLAEEISRYWALQVLIGDNTANANNLRGILSSKRIDATESVKANDVRDPDYYPVELSGVLGSLGATDPTADNSAIDNAIDLTVALPSKYHANAKFVMNRRTLGEYRKLKDLDGRPLIQFESGGFTLVGYPVVVEDYMPEVGATGASNFPVIFGDLSKAFALCNIDDKFLVDPYSADGAVTLKYTSRKGDIVQNNDAIVVFAANDTFPV